MREPGGGQLAARTAAADLGPQVSRPGQLPWPDSLRPEAAWGRSAHAQFSPRPARFPHPHSGEHGKIAVVLKNAIREQKLEAKAQKRMEYTEK